MKTKCIDYQYEIKNEIGIFVCLQTRTQRKCDVLTQPLNDISKTFLSCNYNAMNHLLRI